MKTQVKRRLREAPPRAWVPKVSLACNVLKSTAIARFSGQIIDGGSTRKRLQIPQIEKPISWVDMTSSHWSVMVRGNGSILGRVGSKNTYDLQANGTWIL